MKGQSLGEHKPSTQLSMLNMSRRTDILPASPACATHLNKQLVQARDTPSSQVNQPPIYDETLRIALV